MANTKNAARKKVNERAKQRQKRALMQNTAGAENPKKSRKKAPKKPEKLKKQSIPVEKTAEPALAAALRDAGAYFPEALHALVMNAVADEPLPKQRKLPFIPVGTLAAAAIVVILLVSNGVIGGSMEKSEAKDDAPLNAIQESMNDGEVPDAELSAGEELADNAETTDKNPSAETVVSDHQEEASALVEANRTTARSICLSIYVEGITPEVVLRDTEGLFAGETVGNVIYYSADNKDDLLSLLAVEGLRYSTYNGDEFGKTVAVVFPAAE